MAVSGVLGKWNLSRVDLRFDSPEELYDGLPTLLGIELVNRRRWLPIFLMEIEAAQQRLLFPLVEPQQQRRKNLELTLNGRGRQKLPEVVVRSRFPVNFFIRSLVLLPDQELTVFPAPQACSEARQADPSGRSGSQQNSLKGFEGDISRISDYVGGEPLKTIHWKLSARHDQLKVKELSATSRKPVILDLTTLPGPGIEQQLRQATWLVTHWLREGWPVGLKTGEGNLSPGLGHRHKLLLLGTLALYGQDQKPS